MGMSSKIIIAILSVAVVCLAGFLVYFISDYNNTKDDLKESLNNVETLNSGNNLEENNNENINSGEAIGENNGQELNSGEVLSGETIDNSTPNNETPNNVIVPNNTTPNSETPSNVTVPNNETPNITTDLNNTTASNTATQNNTTTPNNANTPSNTTISRDDALTIALNDAKLNKSDVYDIDVELEYENGKNVYQVSFDYQQKEYDYYINPSDGAILSSLVDDGINKNPTNSSTNYISREDAIATALNDAKLTQNDVRDLEAELEYEYNQNVYEVKFEYQQYEYEYFINAESGTIVNSLKERD